MVNCGSLLKSVLVAIVLMAVVQPGSTAEKLSDCCKTVNRQEITEPIIGYLIQERALPCVRAVIFQTEKGLFCSQLNALWVRRKIFAFEKAKSQATRSSSVSLLSIITSTASPLSSTTPPSTSSLPHSSTLPPSTSSLPHSSSLSPSSSSLRSFPSTSEKPEGETFSENKNE